MRKLFISAKKLSKYLDELERIETADYENSFNSDYTPDERNKKFYYSCGNCNAINAIRGQFGLKRTNKTTE